MLATNGSLPTGPGWAYELKWDGIRALVDISPAGLHMYSRNGNEVTAAYPDLAGLATALEDALLDGEVVALDDGRPSFAALAPRMHVRSPTQARQLAKIAPVTYFAFDILRLYGVDLTARPYSDRRATLERLRLDSPQWMVPPAFDDGPATVAAAEANKLEGVVAKRLASVYRPGSRTTDWVKVKFGHRQEFVVGGWQAGEGDRTGRVGALALGYYEDDGELRYCGQVGSGLAGWKLDALEERLFPLAQNECPFARGLAPEDRKHVTWAAPALVVEIAFANWTPDDKLRFPVYLELRHDKDPREVVRE